MILAHTHIQQSGYTRDNIREVHSLGCMRDPVRTRYMRKKATKFPHWNQGFLMCQDGWYTQLNKNNTNWEALLGEIGDGSEIVERFRHTA